MIPRFHDAKKDRALMGAPLIIYLDLLDDLDPQEFRDVKQLALASELDFSQRTIRDALKLLVDRGYLEAGEFKPSEPRKYRLIYSKPKKS